MGCTLGVQGMDPQSYVVWISFEYDVNMLYLRQLSKSKKNMLYIYILGLYELVWHIPKYQEDNCHMHLGIWSYLGFCTQALCRFWGAHLGGIAVRNILSSSGIDWFSLDLILIIVKALFCNMCLLETDVRHVSSRPSQKKTHSAPSRFNRSCLASYAMNCFAGHRPEPNDLSFMWVVFGHCLSFLCLNDLMKIAIWEPQTEKGIVQGSFLLGP